MPSQYVDVDSAAVALLRNVRGHALVGEASHGDGQGHPSTDRQGARRPMTPQTTQHPANPVFMGVFQTGNETEIPTPPNRSGG